MKDVLEFECLTCGFKTTLKSWADRHNKKVHNR